MKTAKTDFEKKTVTVPVSDSMLDTIKKNRPNCCFMLTVFPADADKETVMNKHSVAVNTMICKEDQ